MMLEILNGKYDLEKISKQANWQYQKVGKL
jgi:hypothetical protein